jgi:hypothetical protein
LDLLRARPPSGGAVLDLAWRRHHLRAN